MNKTGMINYLTKEIATLSTNTTNFRNRISFSLWVGPFIILGSIIVATQRDGFSLNVQTKGAWIAAGLAALGFWGLGIIAGEVEAGAWRKCNEWRQCIIKLQSEEAITVEELEALILDKPIVSRVTQVYTYVFLIILIIFAATAYLVT